MSSAAVVIGALRVKKFQYSTRVHICVEVFSLKSLISLRFFLRLDRKDVTFLIAVSELYQILPAENRVNLHLSL